MPSTKNRKPAQIVKCPTCNWTGSARGLFTHHRLAHPNSNNVIKKAEVIKVHPHAVNKNKKSIGAVNTNATLEEIGYSILISSIVRVINDFFENAYKQQPLREQIKSNKNTNNTHPTVLLKHPKLL